MKTCKRILSIMLAVIIVASMFTAVTVSAATPGAAKITNATQTSAKQLASGVQYTQLEAAAGKYHSTAAIQFDVVEIDMSTQNLYLDVAYGSDRATHAYKSGTTIINSFISKNSGFTPVAAINADLWWLYTGGSTEPANGNKKMHREAKTIPMSLGFSMSNGEIYTSDRMPQESFVGSNGTVLSYEDYISFGITSDSVPVISNPNAQVTIKNTTKGTSTEADGINRLPAYNSLVMYTDRGCLSSYANDDAFEVRIKITSTSDYVIKHGAKISGKVEGIYAPGGSNPPEMGVNSNYIILTARGNKYNSISGYKVGDVVEIGVSVYDQSGKYTAQWQKVTDAIAGHYPFAQDGVSTSAIAADEKYPASFIGITKDNNVIMFTQGSTDGSRKGIKQNLYEQLGKDLNLKDCFMLDGGGSSQLYIPNGSEYKMANNCCEADRTLLDLLILSTGPKRSAQGTVPSAPAKTANAKKIEFSNKANLSYISGSSNDTKVSLENNALKVTSVSGNDPYFSINYELSQTALKTKDNKYLIIEYMLPTSNGNSRYAGQVYYMTGTVHNPDGKYTTSTKSLTKDGKYHTLVVDFSKLGAKWTGDINGIRYDYFNACKAGDVMYIKSITFAATAPSEETVTSTPGSSTPTAKPSTTTSKPSTVTTKPSTTTSKPSTVTAKPGESGIVPSGSPSSGSDVQTNDQSNDVVGSASPTNKPSGSAAGMDIMTIVIIICCVVVVVVVFGLLLLFLLLSRKKKVANTIPADDNANNID